MIVPPLCAVIISVWGWREIFYFFAVPGIVLAVAWYFMVTNHPSRSRFVNEAELNYITEATGSTQTVQPIHAQKPPAWLGSLDRVIRARHEAPLETNKQVFTSWNIWGCAASYCFQLGVSSVLLAWIPTYLMTVKQFSIMNMGLVSAAPWVGAVLGNLIGQLGAAATPFITGLLLDNYGWNYVFAWLAIGSFISFILLLTISEPQARSSTVG